LNLVKIGVPIALVFFVLTGGCSSTGKKEGVPSASREEVEAALEEEKRDLAHELQVGRALAAAILGRSRILSEGEWQQRSLYLRSLGAVLAGRFGRPGIKHHFAWVDSSEVNAFAAPGGYIFLTRGLFERLTSEDELAVILLHEIVHVTEKHVYQKIAPPKATGFAFVLSRLLSGGRGDLGVAVSRSVTQGLKVLFETGLGQELERQADEQAVAMAAVLGYDPESLMRFLGAANEKAKQKAGELKLPATHPPLDVRRNWVNRTISEQKLVQIYRDSKGRLGEQVPRERKARFIGFTTTK